MTPEFERLVEEITFAARSSELVDQTSGVSARVSISAIELLVSNLERRALATGEDPVHPRLCDLNMLLPALTGKVEMVYEGEQKGVEVVSRQIIGEAVRKLFEERFPSVGREVGSGGEDDTGPYSPIAAWFAAGNELQLSDEQPFAEFVAALESVDGLMPLAEGHARDPHERAFLAELILEGLHQALKLGREDLDSGVSYKEMIKLQLLKPRRGPTREVN
jgi:magnesium chelatase subunit I